jgi:nucleotide-binding universal stress UspA family protein
VGQIKHFLVATDGSESGDHVKDIASAMTRAAAGTLRIVTVGLPVTPAQRNEFRRAEGDVGDPARLFGEQFLRKARGRPLKEEW